MDATALRDTTKLKVESLGYRFNPNLPVLDEIQIQRDCNQVTGRILALYASVACAYGFSKPNAIEWLKREGLWDSATENERAFLKGKAEASRSTIQWQVEALWAITWAAGYHDKLDFANSCPDSFIGLFPDLKYGESIVDFRGKCQLRSVEMIGEKLDLSYCLHWAVCDSELSNTPMTNKVEGQVIVERRRALEWLISDDDWDVISLDT